MDSVTQAALGAILGETLLARRLGNRAMLWGAAIGTLPDLDVLAFPLLDSVERLSWHRGLSHSLLFVVLAAPALAWLMRRVHRGRLDGAPVLWFTALNLATHVLIDCFNVYGTQVLEPFSDYRLAFGNLFIIDPLFTLPMLLPLLLVWWRDPASPARRRWPRLGLGLATAYAALSFGLQAVADARFERAIEQRGIPARRWHSSAAPLTTLYWRCLVDAGDEFWIGWVSVLDPADHEIEWVRVPRNEHLLGGLADCRAVDRLRWFSAGYYTVHRHGDAVHLADLRFGDLDVGRAPGTETQWAFDFAVGADGGSLRHIRPSPDDAMPALRHVLRRSAGLPSEPWGESVAAPAPAREDPTGG